MYSAKKTQKIREKKTGLGFQVRVKRIRRGSKRRY
jgi:hypothetical protein